MLGWLRIIARQQRPQSLLHDARRFRSMLDREKSRADRSGGIFSLLAIELTERSGRQKHLRTVARVLHERLRATDLTGFLEDGRVGVLLPDTTLIGARDVAAAIGNAFQSEHIPFDQEVFSYPDSPLVCSAREAGSGSPESQPIEPLFAEALPVWKRGLDITGALLGLFALSPLLLLTAVAIRLTSPGPVFFTQLRTGLAGKPFKLFKFRTMCTNAEQQKAQLMEQNEQDGPAFKIAHDPRVTPIGRILRKSCIDELPQLVNVLRGEMTLVGPRPLPCDESDRCQPWEQRRLQVTPGLTCIWQAGARRVSFDDWMRMDIRYIRRRTLRHDLELLWKTFLKVVRFRASS